MSATVEKHEFKTEARQLLDLMIHSIYSNKDIFLRELISNASDALDKRRFEAIQQPELLPEGTELRIRLEPDTEGRRLSIVDSGIGMSRDDVHELIGTIAKSGTKEFMKKLEQAKGSEVSPDLIGQFGVGFYSVFMVADRVTLVTRKAGEDTATKWESAGDGMYTIEDAERAEAGTTITLHLKETDEEDGLSDFTEEWMLRRIVKQYSDFVAYPIQMDVSRTEVERDEDGKPVEGAEEKTVTTTETLNSMKALWLRDKADVPDEEYNEFYKHISHDWQDPMARIQAKIEGTLEYRLLLFIPGTAPFDMYMRESRNRGVHLYVRRVFIMDECKELLPEYLRFIRGVVDSEDLSLNISREMLQQDRQIERMRKGIVGKVLAFLKDLADKDAEKYKTFWSTFGRVLKEGLFADYENQEALLELSRFSSTMEETELTSLQAYIDRMKTDQDAIYYMTGESRKLIEQSPHLEAFREKGYEVLLLDEPVDEVWTQSVFEFKGKKLVSVGKGAVELGSEDEKKQAEEARKEQQENYGSLLEYLQKTLSEQVKEVRISNRLTSSAACLVTDAGDLTPQMEQMMRAMGQAAPEVKRILEINPKHPILEKLQTRFSADAGDAALSEYAQLLYGQSVLAEGGQLPNPGDFSKLVAKLMTEAL
ncbi:MAG: molecular chaperone HtpG [Candidatus Hydrogenedens sp.]|nr:molecular chaperone HtpG [Candidatus Hydrogenedens sp.]